MNENELAAMDAVESTHWWFVGKRILFERLLADRLCDHRIAILDVGCGTGGTARAFGLYGHVTAFDRSLAALRMARKRGVQDLVAAQGPDLPFADHSFDLALAFDVLEHVEDDRRFLGEIRRVLRPGGAVAIHVPAWPFLWSDHDVALEHHRRYTRRSLRCLIDASELRLDYLGWTSATIFPAAVALRLLRPVLPRRGKTADLFPLPEPLNRFMTSVYRLEAALTRRPGLPFGLSLAALVSR